MDYLYNVIKLTRSKRTLNETINHLSSKGLFPLPDKDDYDEIQILQEDDEQQIHASASFHGNKTMKILLFGEYSNVH